LLHRHPAEVNLPPRAFAELAALRELRNEKMCPRCLREERERLLHRTCPRCNKEFEDAEIQQLLEP